MIAEILGILKDGKWHLGEEVVNEIVEENNVSGDTVKFSLSRLYAKNKNMERTFGYDKNKKKTVAFYRWIND